MEWNKQQCTRVVPTQSINSHKFKSRYTRKWFTNHMRWILYRTKTAVAELCLVVTKFACLVTSSVTHTQRHRKDPGKNSSTGGTDQQDWTKTSAFFLYVTKIYQGFRSHRGTPKSSIYRWGFPYIPSIYGYPHGHGNPHLPRKTGFFGYEFQPSARAQWWVTTSWGNMRQRHRSVLSWWPRISTRLESLRCHQVGIRTGILPAPLG